MSNTKVTDFSYEINDIRAPNDFRSFSFSNFKKTEVRTQIVENMKRGKIEPACYWSAELICAGHYMDLWEIILHYLGKHIHIGNPNLVIYLEKRFSIFRNIITQGFFINELQLRNYNNIRKLFAELICVVTLSPRKHSFEPIKINRVEEFDITLMTERLKAPSVDYIQGIFHPKDPKEIFIALNEFAFHISKDSKNVMNACYWVEWIIEFDMICKNRKEPCYCEKRNQYQVETKFRRDIIWVIWDCMLEYCSRMENPYIMSILTSLLYLFCIKYTTASCKKRRYLLYFAVTLLVEPVPTNVKIIQETDKAVLHSVVEQIDEIYKQIKKNECSPNMDYLYSNLNSSQSNFEETVRKMEIMNKTFGI